MRDLEATLHKKKTPRHKKFGIEHWSHGLQQWGRRSWYATEAARDKALAVYETKTRNLKAAGIDCPRRKVDR